MFYNEESFNRMIEGTKLLMQAMGLNVHECRAHPVKVLKVEADPETPDHVWVYIPEVIYNGCKTTEACADWTVEQWATAFGTIPKLFTVKGHAVSRMMVPSSPEDSRVYANYFWGREANVRDDMKKWNIVLEIPVTERNKDDEEPASEDEPEELVEEEDTAHKREKVITPEIRHELSMKEIEDFQKKFFFMCM